MKTEKKLKRGLADLSSLFLKVPSDDFEKRDGVTMSSPLAADQETAEFPTDGFVSAGFFSFEERLGPRELLHLSAGLKEVYPEIYLLTLDPGEARYSRFLEEFRLSVPRQSSAGDSVRLYSAGGGFFFGSVPIGLFQQMTPPKGEALSEPGRFSGHKPLVLFDSGCSEGGLYDVRSDPHFFELLDHCVIAAPADSEKLTRAYEFLRQCVSYHPQIRASILFSGPCAETLGPFLYERLSEITSRFLSVDLGFLGWIQGDEIRLNPEILSGESKFNAHALYQKRLSETFVHCCLKT